MPLQATSGAASYDAFGGGVPIIPNYIEDVFSTWLYTGNGTTQTITNGIDLSTNGGLTWFKSRNLGGQSHALFDTNRGVSKYLFTDNTNAQGFYSPYGVTAFNTNGFSIAGPNGYLVNNSGINYVSWTFREQPKFFDVVTYTTVSGAMTIPHNLGATPGCWIIKTTNATGSWWVFHRSIPGELLRLNGSSGVEPGFSTATSTNITISNGVFSAGTQIVIYLFAHNAGGFGLTGTDNVISCGSFTTDGIGLATVNLGYEPQWLLFKDTVDSNWQILDTMRSFNVSGGSYLYPNLSSVETSPAAGALSLNATGFSARPSQLVPSTTFIYIAIRRGPMKVPTDATKVFLPQTRTGTGPAATVSNVGFAPDLIIGRNRPVTYGISWAWIDKLRGNTRWLDSSNIAQEATTTTAVTAFGNTGASYGVDNATTCFNYSGASVEQFYFQRAPGFFDVVCYPGSDVVGNAVSHNLGVAPELMIIKGRAGTIGTNDWQVLSKINAVNYVKLVLNATSAELGPFTYANNAGLAAQPTSTTFTVSNTANFNNGATTYVAYLFATCPGVSKVGSYTGNGTTQAIACGFTGGARFVLIKSTSTSGDWYVWDSARGIVAGNDPYLALNSTAAEVTTTDWVDTAATGFELSNAGGNLANSNGVSYIFLAIA